MTVVVAVEHASGVRVGTDSFLGSDTVRDTLDRPKWFYRGPRLLIAFAGSIRDAQIAQHARSFRRQRPHEEDLDYLITAVAQGLHQAFARQAASKRDSHFVIAYRGRAYELQEDFSVVRSTHGYAAIGCGTDFALGALAATEGLAPRKRVREALRAAARHCPQVGGPFYDVNVAAAQKP